MILTIDAAVTDAAGNVYSGSVAVTVNTPAPAAGNPPAAAQAPAQPAQDQMAAFQRRSLMLSRGWGAR